MTFVCDDIMSLVSRLYTAKKQRRGVLDHSHKLASSCLLFISPSNSSYHHFQFSVSSTHSCLLHLPRLFPSLVPLHPTVVIKHPVWGLSGTSFVIFDVRALWRSGLSVMCPDVKNYKWRLNPVWHRMFYSCTNMATVGVKGLSILATAETRCGVDSQTTRWET